MKKPLLILSLLCFPLLLHSQDFAIELNGFRLNQYKDAPLNEFGQVVQTETYDDGFQYEVFFVDPDSTVYMIFMYPPPNRKTIWSIQLSGWYEGFDTGFKNLKLGMSKKEVKEILGEPSTVEDIGEYGSMWSYEQTNYSVEISLDGKLSSIKIMDSSSEFFTGDDETSPPSFDKYFSDLGSGNRERITQLLAPDMEIYKNDSVFSFTRSISSEIKTDYSGIFRLIDELYIRLKNIDPENPDQYEENVRVSLNHDPMHVAKIRLKDSYSEIVFKEMFGEYLIWEIDLK